MSNYAKANTTAQWFQNHYPGSTIRPNVLVIHTTEGTSWPSYGGGASAPTYTARPDFDRQRLDFRAHFPDERSARALRNNSGGVETNTLNAIQLELIGTCDPPTSNRWGSTPHVFWTHPPEWALRDLAAFVADMHKRHAIKLEAPAFLPYPSSYGDSAVRFSFAKWRGFYGVCGHQHVPENTHGDPGNLPVGRVIDRARELVAPTPPDKPAKPSPPAGPVTRGSRVDAALFRIRKARQAAREAGKDGRVRKLQKVREAIWQLTARPKRTTRRNPRTTTNKRK